MVAPEPGVGNTAADATDGGTTFGKLKQTLSSSLLTAQDKGGYLHVTQVQLQTYVRVKLEDLIKGN